MTSTTHFLSGKPKLSLQKKAIEGHTFFIFVYQSEFLGDTYTSLFVDAQSLFWLGIAATELALASLYEDPKSTVLLELESQ
jgi:hypothetical protein